MSKKCKGDKVGKVDNEKERWLRWVCGWGEGGVVVIFFFFNDTATTEIYTLSLHDALPIWQKSRQAYQRQLLFLFRSSKTPVSSVQPERKEVPDRKSTRLNSSHTVISYAVFCLKKKK